MSTIASPRPSITLSPASRRGSNSTDTTITSIATASTKNAPERGSLRRNRNALRDYYRLGSNASTTTIDPPTLEAEVEGELDRADFDATTYVQHLLATESLERVLHVEAGLVGEVRSLDGEKKALVYDNYSKLIAATETIQRMRERMDIPEMGSLGARVGEIGATAKSLQGELRRHGTAAVQDDMGSKNQKDTVRWVLAAPQRLKKLVDDGEQDRAEAEWKEVSGLLEEWKGVEGVAAVKTACHHALAKQQNG